MPVIRPKNGYDKGFTLEEELLYGIGDYASYDRMKINDKYLKNIWSSDSMEHKIAMGIEGIFDPQGVSEKHSKNVAEHNMKVYERARALTFMNEKYGIEPLPPVKLAGGMGGMGGGMGKIPFPTPASLPAGFSIQTLIPDTTFLDTFPRYRGWTHEQMAVVIQNGEYANYLEAGGTPAPEFTALMREMRQKENEDKYEKTVKSKAADKSHSSALDSDDPSVMRKNTYQLFTSMVSGMYSKSARDGIWKDKGAKEWIERYVSKNDKPKNSSDITKMRDAWKVKYPTKPKGTPANEYPDVDTEEVKPGADTAGGSANDDGTGVRPADKTYDDQLLPGSSTSEPIFTDRPHTKDEFMKKARANGYGYDEAEKKWGEYQEYVKLIEDIMNRWDEYLEVYPDLSSATLDNGGKYTRLGGGTIERLPGKKDESFSADGGKTATSSPEDYPGFTRTKIDVEGKDDDKKPRPRPPLDDPDSDDEEEPPKPRYDPEKKEVEIDGDGDSNEDNRTGKLRPSFFRGGQNILALTDAEKIQEIKDYNLFDLPIPDGEDPDNPIYRKNMRDRYYRYFNIDGKWRPKYMYKSKPREYTYNNLERSRIASMTPVMRPSVGVKGQFVDPYDSRLFNTPTYAYRHSESAMLEYADRATNIYTDVANATFKPDPYLSGGNVSATNLMMSMK